MGVVDVLSREQWKSISENAHLVCFNESRDALLDRIDFALIYNVDGVANAYCTIRELDAESIYWQYGGAFPGTKGTSKSFTAYQSFADWSLSRYKRISTYIENGNIVMLKMAMKVGFRIIGTRTFKGTVLVEMLLEKENG